MPRWVSTRLKRKSTILQESEQQSARRRRRVEDDEQADQSPAQAFPSYAGVDNLIEWVTNAVLQKLQSTQINDNTVQRSGKRLGTWNRARFISAGVQGVFSWAFCDFGPDFEVLDSTGEEPKECFIWNITKYCHPMHSASVTPLDLNMKLSKWWNGKTSQDFFFFDKFCFSTCAPWDFPYTCFRSDTEGCLKSDRKQLSKMPLYRYGNEMANGNENDDVTPPPAPPKKGRNSGGEQDEIVDERGGIEGARGESGGNRGRGGRGGIVEGARGGRGGNRGRGGRGGNRGRGGSFSSYH